MLSLICSASTLTLWKRCGCMWLHMCGNHQSSCRCCNSMSSPSSSSSVPAKTHMFCWSLTVNTFGPKRPFKKSVCLVVFNSLKRKKGLKSDWNHIFVIQSHFHVFLWLVLILDISVNIGFFPYEKTRVKHANFTQIHPMHLHYHLEVWGKQNFLLKEINALVMH